MAAIRTLIVLAMAYVLVSPMANAGGEPEACIQTKTWSHYEQGWALRTSTTDTINTGEFSSFSATLYGGRRYLVEICGDATVELADLVLYDREGNALTRAKANGRESVLEFSPDRTQAVYIVIHLRAATAPSAKLALAILHQ
jgi:hypothetical protein